MRLLKGLPVVNALHEKIKDSNIIPKLAIIRIGEREDDVAYEKSIIKKFNSMNAVAEVTTLPVDISQNTFDETIIAFNNDETVHGIMIFQPLPKHLSADLIDAGKDVDCISTKNNAYVYEGKKQGYPPCTPQAVVEILDFYGIDVTGKKVTIVGRSLVVGKPLAMLLLAKNATVTICHTKTVNLSAECRAADILIACAGVPKMINADHVHNEQIIIDVGYPGDVDFESVATKVKAITPVPGGVGPVTTSVLLMNTFDNALKK